MRSPIINLTASRDYSELSAANNLGIVGHAQFRNLIVHQTQHSQSFSQSIDNIAAAKQNPRESYNRYIGMLNTRELITETKQNHRNV